MAAMPAVPVEAVVSAKEKERRSAACNSSEEADAESVVDAETGDGKTPDAPAELGDGETLGETPGEEPAWGLPSARSRAMVAVGACGAAAVTEDSAGRAGETEKDDRTVSDERSGAGAEAETGAGAEAGTAAGTDGAVAAGGAVAAALASTCCSSPAAGAREAAVGATESASSSSPLNGSPSGSGKGEAGAVRAAAAASDALSAARMLARSSSSAVRAREAASSAAKAASESDMMATPKNYRLKNQIEALEQGLGCSGGGIYHCYQV